MLQLFIYIYIYFFFNVPVANIFFIVLLYYILFFMFNVKELFKKIICYKCKCTDNCYGELIFKYRPIFCFFV